MNTNLLLLLVIILSAITIYLIKKASLTDDISYFIVAVFVSSVYMYAYSIILKEKKIGQMYSIVYVGRCIMAMFIGYVCFSESFSTLQYIGLIFALVALYLLF